MSGSRSLALLGRRLLAPRAVLPVRGGAGQPVGSAPPPSSPVSLGTFWLSSQIILLLQRSKYLPTSKMSVRMRVAFALFASSRGVRSRMYAVCCLRRAKPCGQSLHLGMQMDAVYIHCFLFHRCFVHPLELCLKVIIESVVRKANSGQGISVTFTLCWRSCVHFTKFEMWSRKLSSTTCTACCHLDPPGNFECATILRYKKSSNLDHTRVLPAISRVTQSPSIPLLLMIVLTLQSNPADCLLRTPLTHHQIYFCKDHTGPCCVLHCQTTGLIIH